MLAKIISEIPLPIPRWVISSPNHISMIVPAVSARTITSTCMNVKPLTMFAFALRAKVLNRNT